MKELLKSKKGDSIVEATIMLPFCTIMIVAMYFAAIYVCQKANLQANLNNTLIYYKNFYSDTFVTKPDGISFSESDGKDVFSGIYKYDNSQYKNPYRFISMEKPGSDFESYFKTMCGHMFFESPDGENITVKVSTTNYVVYQALTVDVNQSFSPAINLGMVGVDNNMDINISGTVVISDGDDFIRNVDFVIDMVENTKLGKSAKELVGKAKDLYDKFKDKFGVK